MCRSCLERGREWVRSRDGKTPRNLGFVVLSLFFFFPRSSVVVMRHATFQVEKAERCRGRLREVQKWNSAIQKAQLAHDRLRACPGPTARAGIYTGRLHTEPRPVGALRPMLQHHCSTTWLPAEQSQAALRLAPILGDCLGVSTVSSLKRVGQCHVTLPNMDCIPGCASFH